MVRPEPEPEIVELEPTVLAVLRETVPMDRIKDYYDRAFGAVLAAVGRQGVGISGAPFGVYLGRPTDVTDVAAGFPTDRAIVPDEGVTSLVLPGGRAATVVHVGAYDGLGDIYQRLAAWIVEHGAVPGDLMWEQYLTEPTPDADPATMLTQVTWVLVD